MSFAQRRINVTFVLGEGAYGESGENQVELSGLRVNCRIENAGGRSMGTADVRIFGMKLTTMNKLTTLGLIATLQRKNSLTVTAGNDGEALSTVFQGTITNAWTDFQGAPDVAFHVIAQTGLFNAVKPAQPLSVRGPADVAGLLSGLATQMGMTFENSGVDVKLPTSYFGGSARDQAVAIVKAAGIEWNGGEKMVLAIWKPGQSRGGLIPLISKETGMIRSPTYTSNGLSIDTEFNKSLSLGTRVKVVSEIVATSQDKNAKLPVDGEWVIYKIDHSLDAQVPRGQWQSTILVAPPGLAGQLVA